jgi:hypothetical protein
MMCVCERERECVCVYACMCDGVCDSNGVCVCTCVRMFGMCAGVSMEIGDDAANDLRKFQW